MLPPDTSSSLLPWRVMVFLMQMYGCFPYRMSTTSAGPVFSLPLCLWSVFLNLLLITFNCKALNSFSEHLKKDIGTDIYVYTIVIMSATISLSPIVLAVKSDILATLLHDMSAIKGISPPPTYRWYCKKKTLVLLLWIVLFTLIMSMSTYFMLGFKHFIEIVISTPICFIAGIGFLLPEELPSMVFGLLARHLLVATEATVAKVFILLTPDGSFKCESDMESAMVALRDLQAVIREVEAQREKGTRCFFPIITIFLLMSVLLGIACPYNIIKDLVMGNTSITSLLLAYYIMARFCYMGQAFVSQVSEAKGLLEDLTLKSKSLIFNIKVKHVMGNLSPMFTFDMCGWYTLSYSSFLGLNNTILTYVAIILQVGGNPSNINSSTLL